MTKKTKLYELPKSATIRDRDLVSKAKNSQAEIGTFNSDYVTLFIIPK